MMFYIYAGRACVHVSPVERVPKVDEVQQVQARASPLANLKPEAAQTHWGPISDAEPGAHRRKIPLASSSTPESPLPLSHTLHAARTHTGLANWRGDARLGLIGLAALSLAGTRFGDCSRAPPQVSPHQQPAACGATFAAAAPARPQPPRRDSPPALSEAAAMRHGLAARRTVGVGHVCIIGPHATGQC